MEDVQIIYEDDDIIAVNKPAGLLVHPAENSKSEARNPKQFTLVDWLVKNYPEIKNVGDSSTGSGQERPGIVHRLDKDTSGVLLVAKNQKSFEYLKSQFKEKKIKKTYLALMQGQLKEKNGIIDLPIGKSKKDFRKKVAQVKTAGKTREAVTEYRVIKKFRNYTLAEVSPKTGRTHQIRVHLKAIGYPVVCDKLYGPKKQECPFGLTRHFLHASSLELTLPNGARIKLEADLPDDLQNVLNMLDFKNNDN